MKISKFTLISILWLFLVIYGLIVMLNYTNKAGDLGKQVSIWPKSSQLNFSKDKTNLIMFMHPKCPCSQASLTELEKLAALFTDKLKIFLVFSSSDKYSSGWAKTKLWARAKKLQNAEVLIDHSYKETKLFDAHTSGQVLLYNQAGTILFRGGITSSRGHEGDNLGSSMITNYLRSGQPIDRDFMAFGCELM